MISEIEFEPVASEDNSQEQSGAKQKNKPLISLESESDPAFLNYNKYATQKTAVQGCLDFVIFKRNVSDLRKVFGDEVQEQICSLFTYLLVLSVIIHIIAWACMVKLMCMDVSKQENGRRATNLNYVVTILLFIITVLNVILEIKDDSKN